MPANFKNSAGATGLEKVSLHSSPKERQCWKMFKFSYNCIHFTYSKIMLKILQARLQQYMNCELPDVQAGFGNGRSNYQHLLDHRKNKGIPKKKICFIDYAKEFYCVDHNKLWKILKEMGIPDHLTFFLRNLYAELKATEPDTKQQTGSKLGKEYIKAVYYHPAYLTSMQSTSCDMPGWMKHKLESRWLGEISITSAMQMTPP